MKKIIIQILLIWLIPGNIIAQKKSVNNVNIYSCADIYERAMEDLKMRNRDIKLALDRLGDLEICDYSHKLTDKSNFLRERIFAIIDSEKTVLGIKNDQLIIIQNRLKKEIDKANLLSKEKDKARVEAESAKQESQNKTYINAPSEYARRIREHSLNKKEIVKDSFAFKLTAYTEHLDSLRHLINLIKDTFGKGNALIQYGNLMERLYYNNDLYEKIYACIVNIDSNKLWIKKERSYNIKFRSDKDEATADYETIKGDVQRLGKKLTKFYKEEKAHLLICATDDNWIYVYNNGNGTPVLKNKIPMGALVTALDYSADSSIIYFGLKSGNIGYIKYGEDKKNQPVFENELRSPVIAIQLFKKIINRDTINFLLAAGQKSEVVVYKLDEKTLQPDKKYFGNRLPEKGMGDLINAESEPDLYKMRVLIKGKATNSPSELYYEWNPFAWLAVDEHKKKYSHNDLVFKETKIY